MPYIELSKILKETLLASDDGWQINDERIQLGSKQWKPEIVSTKGPCFIHCADDLGRVWRRRFESAKGSGVQVFFAAPRVNLCSSELLNFLDEFELIPIIFDEQENVSNGVYCYKTYRSIPELIALENLKLDSETFQMLAERAYGRSLDATSAHEKGWRFEDMLCLIFSQVSYFKVINHTFNNRTEEIDIVVRSNLTSHGDLPRSPVVLVSAKNTSSPVGVPALKSLYVKMANRRKQCELGFLCASHKVARTVYTEQLRYSREPAVVVPIDGTKLLQIIRESSNLDQSIENMILEEVMR